MHRALEGVQQYGNAACGESVRLRFSSLAIKINMPDSFVIPVLEMAGLLTSDVVLR
jgi:hypothetical protein